MVGQSNTRPSYASFILINLKITCPHRGQEELLATVLADAAVFPGWGLPFIGEYHHETIDRVGDRISSRYGSPY